MTGLFRRCAIECALLVCVIGTALLAQQSLSGTPPEKGARIWMTTPAESERIVRVEGGLAPVRLAAGAPIALDLPGWMRAYNVPGISVAVFDDFRIVWAKTYGVKEAGKPDPVTLDTLFQAGSISKPVTALAVMHYVEQGRLSLDEDINLRLRSWKIPESDFTRTEKVSLRRLLSHSAGLTVHGFPGYATTDVVPTIVQVLDGTKPANTAPVRVDLVPGTQFRYSGGGTTIVQLGARRSARQAVPPDHGGDGLHASGSARQHVRATGTRRARRADRERPPARRQDGRGPLAHLPRDGRGRPLDDALGSRPGGDRGGPHRGWAIEPGPLAGDGAADADAAGWRGRPRVLRRCVEDDRSLRSRRRGRGVPGVPRRVRGYGPRHGRHDELGQRARGHAAPRGQRCARVPGGPGTRRGAPACRAHLRSSTACAGSTRRSRNTRRCARPVRRPIFGRSSSTPLGTRSSPRNARPTPSGYSS